VGAESIDRIRELYDDVFEKIGSRTREKLSVTDVPISSELEDLKERILSIMGDANILKCRNNSLIRDYVKDANSIAKVDKPFIPDGIVYCRAFPLVFDLEENTSDHAIREKITAYQKEHNCDPRIILVEGLGMIGIEENEKALDLVLDMFEDAMKISFYSENFGGQYFMGPEQIRFIEDWEVEKYRRQLSTKA
jgi:rhamnose utilization protein RhaD (predicted bifunctional aldolase and dehydrogenase)